jgi:hypothetical protein
MKRLIKDGVYTSIIGAFVLLFIILIKSIVICSENLDFFFSSSFEFILFFSNFIGNNLFSVKING